MESKRERATLVAVLAVMLLACLILMHLRTPYRYDLVNVVEVESSTGTWDLTGVDFSDTVVKVDGAVEYVEGAILTPDQFAAREGEAQVGNPGYTYEVLTSRIHLIMPEERTYLIADSSIDFSHRLFIDGEERFAAGVPAQTAAEFTPGYGEYAVEARATDGRIEVVQQAANFVHRESGGHDGFYVGLPAQLHTFSDVKGDVELVTLGLFLALFLVHLALWAFFRSYKSNLIFALLCLTWAVRTSITGSKMLYDLFPMLPWELAFRAEYLTLPIGCILVVLLVDDQFPGVMRTWARRGALGVSAAFALAFLVADTRWMSYALMAYYGTFTAIIVYLIVRFARTVPGMARAKTLTVGQVIALVALAVFMYAAIHDALYYLGIYLFGVTHSLAENALLVFALFQTAANFHGTMREVAEARERERRASAEREALAQVNSLKNEFYADVSHEMKTPLTVIAANAQFVAEALAAGEADEETVEDVRAVSAEARRLTQLVSSMVDVSRMQAGAAQRLAVPVDNLVHDTAQLYRSLLARRGNTLVVDIEDGLPEAAGDADQLTQVLVNLLANANRHTSHGTVRVRAERAEGGVRVSVIDDGEGMDEDVQARAFERFSRGDEGGTGLGLSICKAIVERCGGTMGIESESGAGACVWFVLPAKEEAHDRG